MARPISFLWLGLTAVLEKRNNPRLAAFCLGSAIEAHGNAPAGWYLRLGRLQLGQERFAEAVEALRMALQRAPGLTPAWFDLGKAYLESGDTEAATRLYEELLLREPASVDALNALGGALLAHKEPGRALEVFERILAVQPVHPKANCNRVAALMDLKRPDDAEAAARAALNLPDAELAALELNLGNALMQRRKYRDGIWHWQRALKLDRGMDEARLKLAVYMGSRTLAELVPYLERKLRKHGRSRELEEQLAVAYLCNNDLELAEATCMSILDEYGEEESSQAWLTLANVRDFRRDQVGALEGFERSLAIQPDSCTAFSAILFMLQSIPGTSAENLFARHCAWWERYRERFGANAYTHALSDQPGRRLKIGYVSGDLNAHPVGYLLHAALIFRDREAFEVHCFSNVTRPDDVTELLRANVDHWHDVTGKEPDEVVASVREAGIDILVDLAGHTDRNNLPAFARRPAPVQVSWLGYFHSTGTECLDYFISDPHTTPSGSTQRYSETLVHLPHTRFCFVPRAGYPEVSPTPALKNGVITFGCFNRLNKLTHELIAAWARILVAVPGSRLLLKAAGLQDDTTREHMLAQFSAYGIDKERIELRGTSPYQLMLEEYADMDIALDPYPFNGGMTTLEALWMGVPLVALAGEGIVARQSAAILENIGLPELVFDSEDAYVAGAISLAQDVDHLARLRDGMRERMRASPIGDGQRFARDLEALYRRMWHARCKATRLPSDLLADAQRGTAPLSHFVDKTNAPDVGSGMQVIRTPGEPELSFVICSIDDEKIDRLTREIASHLANTAYEQITIRDARSLTEAYNRGAAECKAPYIVFCHDDIYLLDAGFWPKLRQHLQEFDIVGPAGTSKVVSAKWGEAGYPHLHGQVAHTSKECPYNVNIFDGGAATDARRTIDGDIQALDGVFVAMRRTVLDKIRYDEQTFDGFHCYDIDFTYRAYLAGFKLGATYDFAIFHESEGNYGLEWARYSDRFLQKHGATLAQQSYPIRHAGQAIQYETLESVGKAFEMEMRRANQEMIRKKYDAAAITLVAHEERTQEAPVQTSPAWKSALKKVFGGSRQL